MIHYHHFIQNLSRCAAFICLFLAIGLSAQEDSLQFPIGEENTGGLYLDNQIEYAVSYNPATKEYELTPMIGSVQVGPPIHMKSEDYLDLILTEQIKENYRDKTREYDQLSRDVREGLEGDLGNLLPNIEIKSRVFETIFGGSKIELIPKGSAAFDLAALFQRIDNPTLLPQNRQNFTIDLQQRIQLSLLGKVGENLNLGINYDTQAGFAFENRLNLAWKPNAKGGEDNIIQNIEFGNVSMPLNTSLIQGAQSLFGVRTDLKFGKTSVSTVFSQQQSESRNITTQGGKLINTFKIFAEKYEYNKHFLLSQFFRETYNSALLQYPLINSTTNINRVEVWRIDRSSANQQNRRSILAVRDLGENAGNSNLPPENGNLYNNIAAQGGIRDVSAARTIMQSYLDPNTGEAFQDGENYVINENARKLDPSEYTVYPQLGYISLNSPVLDGEDLLAVSIQYTQNGQVKRVGEVSDEEDDLLIVKLLKPNNAVNTESPMWDLMMKNTYSLEAFNISQENFLLNVLFKDLGQEASGTINYLPGTSIQNQTLLQTTGLDRLDQNGNIQINSQGLEGDGLFDFVPGITVNQQNATITFTQIEPFGNDLREQLENNNPQDVLDEFVFDEMYDEIPGAVLGNRLSQRYSLEGRFQGETGGGIPLGAFNVPQGSVTVTANGQELVEGVDYTVDYALGRVNIINQLLVDSGAAINIQLENQSTFNLQQKRFLGLNIEHQYSDNLIFGGTILNYQERPLTQKALFGSEPVSNTLVGANVQYNGTSEYITRLVNKIPGIKTDQESLINFSAEAAYLIPGTNDAVNDQSYIDDFEDSQTKISLLDQFSWQLGSTPGTPAGVNGVANPLFPRGTENNNLEYNDGRRLISWYTIDPRFYGIGGNSSIDDQALSTHRARRIELNEIFDRRDILAGTASFLSTLDITFYPEERGPYNVTQNLSNTENWGALTRPIAVTNFIDANIEYVEFWMMDPYADGTGSDGNLIIQLGNVSEDVLKDGELLFENGLPGSDPNIEITTSNWGIQPDNFPIVYAFDSEGAERRLEDVGFDGIGNQDEVNQFNLSTNNPITGELDPAGDDFLFYLDGIWDSVPQGNTVPGRYRYFRNPENNSPEGSLEVASATPDAEDVNNDFNLDQTESYTQYTIPLTQQGLNLNNEFIVSERNVDITFENGQPGNTTWYQFRIPVDEFDRMIGGLAVDEDEAKRVLTAARFMRVVMQDFNEETTLRFATLDLVRSDWRRFRSNIAPEGGDVEGVDDTIDISNFEIGTVDIETNASNTPPYVLPPGINREQLQGTTGFQSQNESSMVLESQLGGLQARGVFRNVNLDLRRYNRLNMFVHAENLNSPQSSNLDETTKLFIRLGSDYTDNYYEYEISLKYTPASATFPNDIWPEENIIDIVTDLFIDAKNQRDLDGFNTASRFQFEIEENNTDKLIFVKGRPSLGNVSSLMIGLRNTIRPEKNVLVWVNELRLSEIDNEGGFAATASLGLDLGDFAQINAVGNYQSVGFGAIDLGPSLRSQEEIMNYSINAQLKLDKFLPEKWGIELPMNVTFREEFVNPKFNPLDNDVEFDAAPNRDELEDIVRTYTRQKSIGFSNIRKVRTQGRTSRFYDLSNLSLSFVYADDYFRDIYTQYNIKKKVSTSLNYSYNFRNKFKQPFKDWRMVNDTAKSEPYLQWVKEFNYNLLPSRISFRTDIVRTYTEQQFRDINQFLGGSTVQFDPVFSSNFLFSWQYNVGFDLTRSLKLDYTSSTRTLNDGPQFLEVDQQLIWRNLTQIGRPVNYDQNVSLNWRTPLHLLPYLFWTSLEVGFNSSYNWQANSTVLTQSEFGDLGNTAQNANSINMIGNLKFNDLYQEIGAFQKLDSIRRGRKRELDSLNQVYEGLSKRARKRKKSKRYKFKHKYKFKDYLLLVASSVKQAQLNYEQTNGAVLPGLIAEPNFFGLGSDGSSSPGLGFIFGTEFDIKSRALANGWITDNELLLEPFQLAKTTRFTYKVQIEPINKLRIDINGVKNSTSRSLQTNFNLVDVVPDNPNNPLTLGNQESFINEIETLNTSLITSSTSFTDPDDMYNQFIENTQIISARLGVLNPNSTGLEVDGYFDGYGIANADVLVPAFLSAIQGTDASGSRLGHSRNFPLPNWTILYNGLIDVPWFAKRLTAIELSHNYVSSYTISGVQSNINFYNAQVDSSFGDRDINQNFYAANLYGSINVSEAFSPLLGVDLTFRNNLQLRAQYNRDRIISLSINNYTLNEQYGNELVAGLGYIFKDLKLKTRYRGKKKTIKGDLNLRADLRIRDNETRLRRIVENDSQVIGGQRVFSLRINADYNLSKNFNLKFFYEQDMTEYQISTAFPINTTRAGISATFTFGN